MKGKRETCGRTRGGSRAGVTAVKSLPGGSHGQIRRAWVSKASVGRQLETAVKSSSDVRRDLRATLEA